jgi:hypothetical protein
MERKELYRSDGKTRKKTEAASGLPEGKQIILETKM